MPRRKKERIEDIPEEYLIKEDDLVKIKDGKRIEYTFYDEDFEETRDWRKAVDFFFDEYDLKTGELLGGGGGILRGKLKELAAREGTQKKKKKD